MKSFLNCIFWKNMKILLLNLKKTGSLKRFLTNNRLRKNLENLNSTLHKYIEYFVELIIQVEVKNSERQFENEKNEKFDAVLETTLLANENINGLTEERKK